jgi:hypothetical protein
MATEGTARTADMGTADTGTGTAPTGVGSPRDRPCA